jgi:hypothetical protein
MVAEREGNKKIWLSEFGYWANPPPPAGYEYCSFDRRHDPGQLSGAGLPEARGLDYVAGMMVWNLNYRLAVPQPEDKWDFGIVRADWSARSAYSALANRPKTCVRGWQLTVTPARGAGAPA